MLIDCARGLTAIEAQSVDFNSRDATYTPKSPDWRYYWTTGNDATRSEVTTYGQSAWLGIDAFAADPDNIVDGPYAKFS